MPGPYDSRAIANEMLLYASEKGISLIIMQLLKLIYMAHGWSLAVLKRPLISHDVQAWQYGPVYPLVYKAFKNVGSMPVSTFAHDKVTGAMYRADLDDDERQLLRTVVDLYGTVHAFQLSNWMHREGTPWTETYKSAGPYKPIPNDLIQRHFETLVGEGQSVAAG